MPNTFEFSLDGREVQLDVPANTPLLMALRNDLGTTGTRQGCLDGDCGACTVLLDGQPINACSTSVDAAAGHRVETVTSLYQCEPKHPLLDAFIEEQAGQCGYCLSGILMRASAFLANHLDPSREEVAAALDDHLCRCGAHNRIIKAVLRAAEKMRGES